MCACLPTKLSATRNKRIVQAFMDFRDSEKTRETEALASGDDFVKEAYKVKTKLSETKESFYSDLAQVLQIFQTDEFKEKIKTESWKPLMKCFDPTFQIESVLKVLEDTTNKYFSTLPADGEQANPTDALTVGMQRATLVDDVIEAHEDYTDFTPEGDRNQLDLNKFVGRSLVNPVDGRPGRVTSFKKTKKIFEVKYYEDTLPTPGQKKRAKNVLQIDGREALLPLLLHVGDDDDNNADLDA